MRWSRGKEAQMQSVVGPGDSKSVDDAHHPVHPVQTGTGGMLGQMFEVCSAYAVPSLPRCAAKAAAVHDPGAPATSRSPPASVRLVNDCHVTQELRAGNGLLLFRSRLRPPSRTRPPTRQPE